GRAHPRPQRTAPESGVTAGARLRSGAARRLLPGRSDHLPWLPQARKGGAARAVCGLECARFIGALVGLVLVAAAPRAQPPQTYQSADQSGALQTQTAATSKPG